MIGFDLSPRATVPVESLAYGTRVVISGDLPYRVAYAVVEDHVPEHGGYLARSRDGRFYGWSYHEVMPVTDMHWRFKRLCWIGTKLSRHFRRYWMTLTLRKRLRERLSGRPRIVTTTS